MAGAGLLAGGAAPDHAPLDVLARRKGLRFGTALGAEGLADRGYLALVARECGALVAENEHKLYALKPGAPDEWRWAGADRIAAFAADRGMFLRGHTLLWNRDEFAPDWLKRQGLGSQAEGERWLTAHVRTVIGRYPQIRSWDVVNETIDPATGAMRDTVFTRAMGADAVEIAFRAAHEAAPQARLAYNDYMGWGPSDAKHRAGVLRLLERLKARGVPIHTFGVQGHIPNGDAGNVVVFSQADQREWRAFVDEVRGLGLDLVITQLDVNDTVLPADPTRRDAIAAGLVRDFLDLMLDYRELKQVLVWGLSDRHSWLQTWWPRPDRLPKRPTPYDAELRPKAMRAAIADALRGAPERTPWT
jgi:endo-1,4-beta-xylanase